VSGLEASGWPVLGALSWASCVEGAAAVGGLPKLKSAGPKGHEGAGATEDVEGWDPEALGVTPNLKGNGASDVAGWPG